MAETPEPARQRFPVDGAVGAYEPETHPDYAEVVAFFGHLAYNVEPLRPVLARHLLDSEGELLPHLLMSDVTDWLLRTAAHGSTLRSNEALRTLEHGYVAGSEGLRSVMVASFLEQLPGFAGQTADPAGVGASVRSRLGPTMKNVLATIEQWREADGPSKG